MMMDTEHLQKDHNHYPIEIQFMTPTDRQLMNGCIFIFINMFLIILSENIYENYMKMEKFLTKTNLERS